MLKHELQSMWRLPTGPPQRNTYFDRKIWRGIIWYCGCFPLRRAPRTKLMDYFASHNRHPYQLLGCDFAWDA